MIAGYKALLAKNKMRFVGTEESEVAKEREYRMIPSERWANVSGVQKYDKLPVYKGEIIDFPYVEIATNQHIGAPSVVIVKDGDRVEKGDKIAESADGLSLPQYASVNGTVTVWGGKTIRIDR